MRRGLSFSSAGVPNKLVDHKFLESKIGGFKIFDRNVGSYNDHRECVYFVKKILILIHFSPIKGARCIDGGGH